MEMTPFQRIEAGAAGRLLLASESFVRRVTKDRRTVDGESLDRRAQYMFTIGRVVERSMSKMTPKSARRYYARLCRVLEAAPPPIGRTTELTIPTRAGPRRARAFYPRGGDNNGARPGLVYYHGGGFAIGSIDTHDTLCRRLCAAADCVVVSVDYRLAPEHPFPAGIEDCYDAYRWVREQAVELGIAPERLAVGGDSAGGNLSTVVSLLARDEGIPLPCVQLLIYPGVADLEHAGRQKAELQTGYGLDWDTLRWFAETYLPGGMSGAPRAAPLYLESHEGLCPAIVVTAQFDLLCEEGRDYVAKLRAAGVPVTHLHVNDLPHGFGTMSVLPRAREAIAEFGAALREALHRP